jgi:6-phosphofructokinase
MKDKKGNPSNYAMVTISEGAHMVLGGRSSSTARPTPTATSKLGGIGQLTGEALKKLTGEDIIYQQVSYLMRSGAPDALDLMVASTTPTWPCRLIASGVSGRMVALRDGTYTHIPMSTVTSGVKRVDVR